jgi:hypothetical protein
MVTITIQKKVRYFKTHESAKKYFYYIGKQNGVKKVELTTMEHTDVSY